MHAAMQAISEVNAAFPWFFPTFVFILGAMIGSFLNVCIFRIPAERSIVTPGSTCACGQRIAWYDNIPILSWILLRGRARCCGRRFSIRYPAVELLTAVLFLLCWRHHPPTIAAAGMVLTAMLICATFIDLDHMIIPDRFSIGLAVVGVAISLLVPELHGRTGANYYLFNSVRALFDSFIGILIGSGVVLWIGEMAEKILRKEAMGFGDVKLVGGIGAFLGWEGALFSIFGGAVLGTIVFAAVLGLRGLRGKRPGGGGSGDGDDDGEAEKPAPGLGQETPFGPMLAGAALIYFFWLHGPVDAYFSRFSEMLNANF